MSKLSENQAAMILNALPHIGPCTAKKLLSHFQGDIRRIFSATFQQLKEIPCISPLGIESIINHGQFFDLEREEKMLSQLRGQFFSATHDSYPTLLREIYDSPVGIYAIGEIDNFAKNISIVGSRTSTFYGLETARKLAMELAKRGFCIISGMARGIDAAAHEGALSVDGKTIAVLGNGIDIIYPQENAAMYGKISKMGAIISEFPLGRYADRQTFPIRNRLIAGLSHAVIIVESSKFGGSMITARYAGEYGRHVFAVPGRIDQQTSGGCLSLIKEGATMLTCIEDIFEDLPYLDNSPKQEILPLDELQTSKFSCPIEQKICEILVKERALPLDVIVTLSELSPDRAMHALQMMEMRGFARRRYDGTFEVGEKIAQFIAPMIFAGGGKALAGKF
jgi:DNA processing protein